MFSYLFTANQQNYVASPVSVLMLLSALLGAKGPQGETADQLCQAIKGNTDKCSASVVAEIHQNAEKTMRQLTTARSVAEPTEKVVRIANAAFVQKDLMLKSSFESEFEKDNVSTIAKIDFLSPEAYKTVNAWVNRTTGGLINEIFKSPNDISKDVLMMLLNSVYFKGQFKSRLRGNEWQTHFLRAKVKDRTFRTLSSEKTVKMMRENEYILYYSDEVRGFKLVAKPFSNERFQFVVILPTEDLKIEKLNALFKEGFDWTVLKKASEKRIELFLPRFKLEHEVDLVPTLQSMGVRNLFSKGLADLSGITTEAMLYVGAAKQNAILEVTETGVKAAAVSSMQMMPMSLRPKGEPFIVDQPFFCAVYDIDLMLPLFLARVMDPQPV
ncbi:unnamed protein product [Dibothriocephalus latus]|uniref:Serpin domain-containing protein n=1 Tax=Dibothriocephalus latus TaxID=60516 RepID=A0A3P7LEE3_DIBLA|nr:unnamed protein product [Dibothriocephalus latus]